MRKLTIRAALLVFAIAAIALVFLFGVHPWFIAWGATHEEFERRLPGDEIIAGSSTSSTRAITINAPVETVWAWLAQTGQDRGGFYSYEILEDLVGGEMPDVYDLRPELQQWKPGDKLWMYPPDKLGGIGYAELAHYEPGRVLGFATRQMGSAIDQPADGSWTFVLEPVDAQTTRMLVRGRGIGGRGPALTAYDRFIFDPAHYAMERKMMQEIKLRAEGGASSKAADNAQVALWTLTFVLFWTSAVLLFRRRRWSRTLASLFAAAALFQLLTLVQPAPVLGTVMVAALAIFTLWPQRRVPAISPSALLDKWLPGAQFRDTIVVGTNEPTAMLLEAFRRVTVLDMPLALLLGWLRYLPAKGEAARRAQTNLHRPFLDTLLHEQRNLVLEERTDELVLGMAGKLHQIRDQEPVALHGSADFTRFSAPAHEKLAMSVRVVEQAEGNLLVLEHRTLALDERARRLFARYWLVIKPSGAFMTRQLLRAAIRRARHQSATRQIPAAA